MAKQVSDERKKRRKPLSPREYVAKYGALRKAEEAANRESAERFNSVNAFFRPLASDDHELPPGVPRDLFHRALFLKKLARSVDVKLLRRAAEDEEPEAFKALLLELLSGLGVDPPAGVFTKWPKMMGKRGRPAKSATKQIYDIWTRIGEPSLYKTKLAQEFYGKEFKDADPETQRGMVQRCRKAVERGLKAHNRELEAQIRLYRAQNDEIKRQLAGSENV